MQELQCTAVRGACRNRESRMRQSEYVPYMFQSNVETAVNRSDCEERASSDRAEK